MSITLKDLKEAEDLGKMSMQGILTNTRYFARTASRLLPLLAQEVIRSHGENIILKQRLKELRDDDA